MNTLTAIVRTLTAYLVGGIVTGLYLLNIHVPEDGTVALAGFLTIVFSNAYYILVTLLARIWPWVSWFLLVPSEPTYGAGHDLLWAFLRTLIPSIVGFLLSLIPTSIIVIDPSLQTTLIVGITASAQSGYYALLKIAETRWKWLSVLLGGKPTARPTYSLAA